MVRRQSLDVLGLNPCSCGRWLQRVELISEKTWKQVLILVLVEDGFRDDIFRADGEAE